MYQKVVLFFGILGTILSLLMGYYSIVSWEIVAVLVTVSIGIPSLFLGYEKVKPKEDKTDLGKVKDERVRMQPPESAGEEIKNESESEPLKELRQSVFYYLTGPRLPS